MSDGASFTWYGHSCVQLKTPGGKVVLLDPWFGNPTSPQSEGAVDTCDLMLVSHGHHDHLGAAPRAVRDADSLAIARRTRPTWVAVHELSLWLETELDGAGVEIIGMNKGGTVSAAGLTVSMVRADHSAGDWLAAGEPMMGWAKQVEGPMYLGEPVGFVIGLEDGRKVYYTGDTDLFGDLDLVRMMHKPDVAIMPIGGHYTMGPAGAARAAKMLDVRAVIPVHYGTFPILAGTPDELRTELGKIGAGRIAVIAPDRGVETPLP